MTDEQQSPVATSNDQQQPEVNPEEIAKLNVYQRLNEIRKIVSYVQKDQSVGFGNNTYKAVTHDAVTATIRDHLIAFGVIVVPGLEEGLMLDTGRSTSSGTKIWRYEAIYQLKFINIDRPEDYFVMRVAAHADDTGDKAPGKCLSYAQKSGYLKILALETGEDDESRYAAVAAKISDEHHRDLILLCDKYEFPAAKTLKRMAATLYGLKEIGDLSDDQFETARDAITAKGEQHLLTKKQNAEAQNAAGQ